MSRTLCFETICCENRELKNLSYHEARLNRTRHELWGYSDYWNLSERIVIPDSVDNALYKYRLSYNKEIEAIKWEPYTPRTIQKIRRVYHDTIDYRYKYEDRNELNTLFAQRKDADEILIIKNSLVTDSFYCNVAFYNGNDWFTPRSPLLPGTQRAFLLDSGVIREAEIRESDLREYSKVKLFNAMVGWEDAVELGIESIA
ncbi:aminotransferase class IV family protein [Dyadobacter sp. LJ53]|uniref:aminotransferase class IV family protein n=1 Tax=Dyadobacter chenwenxiniae TaxID=2906456 RepID=UPI001F427211|nr:aminotransferase class IV family protein [Dyadobacter chenwenxiniae]MCF0051038.1 aminotransferase class IV family protein [Dyadobacter chenwenxiniae]